MKAIIALEPRKLIRAIAFVGGPLGPNALSDSLSGPRALLR